MTDNNSTAKMNEIDRVLYNTKNTGGPKTDGQYQWEKHMQTLESHPIEPILQSQINTDVLTNVISHLDSDCGMHTSLITEEGMLITTEADQPAMTTAWVDKTDFEEYTVKKVGRAPIVSENMLQMLSHTNKDTVVHLNIKQTDSNKDFESSEHYNGEVKWIVNNGLRMESEACHLVKSVLPNENLTLNPPDCQFTLTGSELERVFSTIREYGGSLNLTAHTDSNEIRFHNDERTCERQYTENATISDADAINSYGFNPSITNDVHTQYQTFLFNSFVDNVNTQYLKTRYDIAVGDKRPTTIKRDVGTNSFVMKTIAPLTLDNEE